MKYVLLAIALAIVMVLVSIIVFQVLSPKYERNISGIEVATQQMGGATIFNYMPLLSEDLNWDTLTNEERIGTARAATKLAIDRASQEGVSNYNVLGLSALDRQTLFLCTSGDEVIVLYSGDGHVPVPLNG